MKKSTLPLLISGIALLALASCNKELTQPSEQDNAGVEVTSKLIRTSENATKGSLLVYFGDDAVKVIEGASSPSADVLTKSGISDVDLVLQKIGAYSMHRLFPQNPRFAEEERAAGLHRWYVVSFDDEMDLDIAARKIASLSDVTAVEFNQKLTRVHDKFHIVDDFAAPTKASSSQFNDPGLAKQWHHINTGDKAIYSKIKEGADVNCAEAWRLCAGDPRVVVAVVDDCVQWDHPDLAANMWVNEKEKNGTPGKDDDGNGFVDDIHGHNFVTNGPLAVSGHISDYSAPEHGTHVAGTVAAVNNNGVGVTGIAGGTGNNDGVRIMSCQIFYNDNGGTPDGTAKAIKYAADNGACIIQCSFGLTAGKITSDDQYIQSSGAVKHAIDYFLSKSNCPDVLTGGLVIFAAGNDATGMCGYHGAYHDYIAVTAASCDFTPAYYTNYGPGCNIAAPGGDLYQSYIEYGTDASGIFSTVIGGKYGYSQGTSMACPHVSGVAALGLSYGLKIGRKFTRSEFEAMLLTSVNSIDPYCVGDRPTMGPGGRPISLDLAKYKGLMGTGLIDAYQLLMNIRGTTCIPVNVGKQYSLDLVKYVAEGDINIKITDINISSADMQRIGMTANPTIFGNKVLIKCTKPASAIATVTFMCGTSDGSGINGKTIKKEFAIIARPSHAENGGWL